jgi:hypothetical protein
MPLWDLALLDELGSNGCHGLAVEGERRVAPIFEQFGQRSSLIVQWNGLFAKPVGHVKTDHASGFINPENQIEAPIRQLPAERIADKRQCELAVGVHCVGGWGESQELRLCTGLNIGGAHSGG